MKLTSKLRGGRRHFHFILFILLSILIFTISAMTNSNNTSPSNSITIHPDSITIPIIEGIEYRSPYEIEIDKLYSLITTISTISSETERRDLAKAVYQYGTQYSIEPVLLLAIARVESNFTIDAVGGRCVGYFQINLGVHRVSNNFANNVYEQAEMACKIINYCKNIYSNRINYLNSYNGNSANSNPYANKVIRWYERYMIIYQGD